jgi:hypothetical protein
MNPVFSYICKTAFDRAKRDKALRTVDTVKPYFEKGLAGMGAGLWIGTNINKLRTVAAAAGAPPQRALPIALAVIGAGLGLGDEKLRHLAREAKYRTVLKETRTEG